MDDAKPQALLPLIVADVYELAGRFRADGEAIARGIGQTQARWQVLSAASGDPRTVPQIARRLGVSRQNVQRIADQLAAEHWASFQANPDHRGSPHLILTRRGRAVLDQLTRAAESHHAKLARKLSTADMRIIHRGLRLLTAATSSLDPPDDQE